MSNAAKKVLRWIEKDEMALRKACEEKNNAEIQNLKASIAFWSGKLNKLSKKAV